MLIELQENPFKIVAISRGSINHSFKEDLLFLMRAFLRSDSCKRAKQKTRQETENLIKVSFNSRNAILTPYARTSLYLILKSYFY